MEWARIVGLVSVLSVLRAGSVPLVCHMFCQTGFFLEINSDGSVNGCIDDSSPHAVLEILRLAVRTVCIKGVASGKYLCMSKKGRIYASKERTVDCVFDEEYLPVDNYYLFSSQKHKFRQKKMYLAVSKSGKPRPGRRRAQKRTLFYVQLVERRSRWRRT